MEFVDRQSDYINRKKLTIIKQTPTSLIVDMDRADNPSINGTSINAEVFNNWNNIVNSAVTTSTQASVNATTALGAATEAKAKSEQALFDSNAALTKANTAIETVQTNLGTIVKVNNEPQVIIDFSSEPQSQLNNLTQCTTELNQNVEACAGSITTLASAVSTLQSNETNMQNSISNAVTLSTEQTITGAKHFTNNVNAKKIICTEIDLLI